MSIERPSESYAPSPITFEMCCFCLDNEHLPHECMYVTGMDTVSFVYYYLRHVRESSQLKTQYFILQTNFVVIM